MKNATRKLERSREFWLTLCITFFFFLLRIPSLFEPYWYGDEGIYETIGLALTKGRILYTEIWDNKPPLLYYTYALVGGDQFLIRLLSLVTGIFTIIIFSLLAKTLLKKTSAVIISTFLFSVLFGLPMFEGNIANAENFMLLPVLTAVLMMYRFCTKIQESSKLNTKHLFTIGLLLGIAFLYKIVAIFDFAAIFLFLLLCLSPKTLSVTTNQAFIKKHLGLMGFLLIGFLSPFIVSIIFFAIQGAAGAYIQAIFLSTVGYVGHNNAFIIPQGLLITKLLLLGAFTAGIFLQRKKLSPSSALILLWVAFSLFSSFFSQRPYTHYVLVLIAPLSLLGGLTLTLNSKQKAITSILFLFIASISLNFFDHWSLRKTRNYYVNFTSFINGQKSMGDYYSFFDQKAIRDDQLAHFINNRANNDNSLFMWGNSAQLYYLTHTVPPGRFTVAYHMSGIKPYLDETKRALQDQPRFIIILDNAPPYPFSMYNYQQVLKIQEANIYERSN